MSDVGVLSHWLHKADSLFRVRERPETVMEYDYKCPCGKSFKRKATYQRHMDVAHSSTASFKCEKCGKTFGNENQLTMHMSVHDIKRVFDKVDHTDTRKSSSPDKKANHENSGKPVKVELDHKENNNNIKVEVSPKDSLSKSTKLTCKENNSCDKVNQKENQNRQSISKVTLKEEVLLPTRRSSRQLKKLAQESGIEVDSKSGNISESSTSKMKSSRSPTPVAIAENRDAESMRKIVPNDDKCFKRQDSCLKDEMRKDEIGSEVHMEASEIFVPDHASDNMVTKVKEEPRSSIHSGFQNQDAQNGARTVAVESSPPPPYSQVTTRVAAVSDLKPQVIPSPPVMVSVAPPTNTTAIPTTDVFIVSEGSNLSSIATSLPSLVGGAIQGYIVEHMASEPDSCLEELKPLLNSNIQIKIENIDEDDQYGGSDLNQQDMGNAAGLRKSLRPRPSSPAWKSLIPGQTNMGEELGLENRPRRVSRMEVINPDAVVKSETVDWTDCDIKPNLEDGQIQAGRKLKNDINSKRSSRETAGAIIECYICGKKFASEKYLSMHVSLHSSVKSGDFSAAESTENKPTALENSPVPSEPTTSISPGIENTPTEPTEIVEKKPNPSRTTIKDNNGWTCQICNKFFHHTSGYKNHMRTHSDERPFVCQICDIGFKEKYHLKKHNLFIHSTELPEKCRYCGKRFKDSTAVRAHERIHSDLRPFSCRRCGKAFKTSECLWHHEHRSKSCGAPGTNVALPSLRGQTRRRNFKKAQQEEAKPPAMPIQPNGYQKIRMAPEPAQESCTEQIAAVAKQLFPLEPIQQQQLQQHEMQAFAVKAEQEEEDMSWMEFEESDPDSTMSGADISNVVMTNCNGVPVAEVRPMQQMKEEYACKICKKVFYDITVYGKHARMHLEERPFVCSICDIGFKMKVHLKKHNLYVHSDEYPCACSFCGKRFKDSSAVKLHERIHSNVRPFECDACGKTFKTNENLWGHQHRGKCHAMIAKMEQNSCGDVPLPDDITAHASLRGKDQMMANASAQLNQVTAQAYIGNSQVTARAVILNNQLTAHASITGQDVIAQASIQNSNISAQASIGDNHVYSHADMNDKVKVTHTSKVNGHYHQDPSNDRKMGVASPMLPASGKTLMVVSEGTSPASSRPPINAIAQVSAPTSLPNASTATFRHLTPATPVASQPPVITCVALPTTQIVSGVSVASTAPPVRSTAAMLNPVIASALLKPPNCPPVEVPQFSHAALMATPTKSGPPPPEGSPSQKLPTLKEFLARGVAGSKSPAWHLGSSSYAPPKSPTPGATNGVIKVENGSGMSSPCHYRFRSCNPPMSIPLTPPSSRKSPAFHSGSPFMGRASPCSDISPFGSAPIFPGGTGGIHDPLLGHDYWDEEDDENPQQMSAAEWQGEDEPLFEMTDSVMTQL